MNRTLTSAALGSIKIHGEHLADYLDTLEISLDPEVLKASERVNGKSNAVSGRPQNLVQNRHE